MANDLTRNTPPGLTPLLSKSLGSQDLNRHRAAIAVELEVMARKYDRFGWDRDRGSQAHDRLMLDWMDALHDYPLDEIQAACRACVQENPNRMPNEGHVLAAILKARAAKVKRMPRLVEPEPERKPVSAERAAEILKDAGFAPRRFP